MNILYLIGNGFDVAQGLKTRYPDFYGSYKQTAPINDEERRIIASIDNNVEKWSDMEAALGVFTKEVNSAAGFIDAYESLSSKLSIYLKGQDEYYRPNNIERYRKELANPFEDLSYPEAISFNKYVSSFGEKKASIDVISFNYTNVFERAIGYEYQAVALEGPYFSQGVSLNRVYKIHGSLQGTVVMGVNDAGQIANDAFAKNQDVCDMIVKPQTNAVMGLGFDILSGEMISAADLIIVYGMSIGETDRVWWQRIAERMASPSVRMIIFYHLDEQVPTDKGWRVGRIQRMVKERFENISSVPEELREEMEKRIYVSTKGFMFNPNVVKYNPAQ